MKTIDDGRPLSGRWTLLASTSLIVTMVVTATVASTAWGDYFDRYYADNAHHDMWYPQSNLGTERYNAVHKARTIALEGGTVFTTSQASQYTIHVDVAVIMKDPEPHQVGWYAWVSCRYLKSGSTTVCDQFVMHFSTTLPHSNFNAVACHELGHTVGLKDGQKQTYGDNSASPKAVDRSCMRSNPDVAYYSVHDKNHISSKY